MIRAPAWLILGALLPALAWSAQDGAGCDPEHPTERLEVRRLGAALTARIDLSRIALSPEDYCARVADLGDAVVLPVRTTFGELDASVVPLIPEIDICREQSRGLQLFGIEGAMRLYSDGLTGGATLACIAAEGRSVTVACRDGEAVLCQLWSVKELEPGCRAWLSVPLPREAVADWQVLLDEIETAIAIEPGCNRQTERPAAHRRADLGERRHG